MTPPVATRVLYHDYPFQIIKFCNFLNKKMFCKFSFLLSTLNMCLRLHSKQIVKNSLITNKHCFVLFLLYALYLSLYFRLINQHCYCYKLKPINLYFKGSRLLSPPKIFIAINFKNDYHT